jgi:hypothetical protein
MSELHRKPFWKRKRWIAAAVLWPVILYPLSEGPVFYCTLRDWLPSQASYIYMPRYALVPIDRHAPRWAQPLRTYLRWWARRAVLDGDRKSAWRRVGGYVIARHRRRAA